MENVTVTVDHVRELRDRGSGYALFRDGDDVIVSRESIETADLMMIGEYEALAALAEDRHDRDDLATDADLAKDLTDIADDLSPVDPVAHAKIAAVTRCLINHGITRTGGTYDVMEKDRGYWKVVQRYTTNAAPGTNIKIASGRPQQAPISVAINNGDTTVNAGMEHNTPPAAIAAFVTVAVTANA